MRPSEQVGAPARRRPAIRARENDARLRGTESARRARRSSGRRGKVRRAAAHLAPALLFCALIVAPQLLGGTPGWATAVIGALAGAACIAAAWTARSDRSTAGITGIGVLGIALLGWTIAQALPLPRGLVDLLQHDAVAMSNGAAAVLSEDPPAWLSLSLAPVGTRAEIIKGAAMLAVFFAAALLVALGHRERVFMAVAASILVMAVVAFAHLASGTDRVFGVYEAPYARSFLLAPLVNQNCLSGFLGMGAPLLLGLALDAEERRERIAWSIGAAVAIAGAILAFSRGGVASLLLGLVAFGVLALARKRRDGSRGPWVLAIAALPVGAGVAAALYIGAEGLFSEFEHGGFSKLQLAARGLGLAMDHPFTGVGRGAFSTAFVWEHGSTVRFTHPENFLAQWASEWGLPVAVIVVVAISVALFRAAISARSWAHRGGIAAIVAIGAHDLVDFATELPGVAVVVVALAGAVLAPSRRGREAQQKWAQLWRVGAAAGTASLALALLLGWNLDHLRAASLRSELEGQMRRRERAPFARTVREAVRLHPGEPVFVLLGGAEAVRRDDPSAIRWLNRAMVLAPGWSAPHEETARWLMRRRRYGQAMLEVREAAVRGGQSTELVACAILARSPTAVDVLLRAAGDADGRGLLDRTGQCLDRTSRPAVAIDRHLMRHGVLGARIRTAERALAAHAPREALRALEDTPADDDRVVLLRAQAYVMAREPRRAIALLGRAEDTHGDPRRVLTLRAEACVEAGDAEGMRSSLEQLRGREAGSAREIASIWVHEGRLEERLGNVGRALAAFERAHRLDRESEGLPELARLSESQGDWVRTYQAYTELCARGETGACAHRDRIRARFVESDPGGAQP